MGLLRINCWQIAIFVTRNPEVQRLSVKQRLVVKPGGGDYAGYAKLA
jgi:hypothetical protein